MNDIFNVIGKKNIETLVFSTDREIPTLGPTDNAGNLVNLISGIIRSPSDWDFLVSIGNRYRFHFLFPFCHRQVPIGVANLFILGMFIYERLTGSVLQIRRGKRDN